MKTSKIAYKTKLIDKILLVREKKEKINHDKLYYPTRSNDSLNNLKIFNK